jgi:Chitobiase/beta-hexosaminidase C-terminal domain
MKKMTLLGAFVALILVVFPVASARATQCDDVIIYWEYGGPTGLVAGMDTDTPTPRTIFYTINGTDPTHNGGTPGSGTSIFTADIPIPYMSWRHFRALCYKEGYDDSNITIEDISNPIQ